METTASLLKASAGNAWNAVLVYSMLFAEVSLNEPNPFSIRQDRGRMLMVKISQASK